MASKNQGGLGIGSLQALNISLLAKWWWKLKSDNSSLWADTVHSIHGFYRRSPRDPLLSKKHGTWGSILSINNLSRPLDADLFSLFHISEAGVWRWSLDPSGDFTVSSFRSFLDYKLLHNSCDFQTYWSKLLPGKVNLHGWKTLHKRLPTFANLLNRGIIAETKPCCFCDANTETEEHIFAECRVALAIVKDIADWWNIAPPQTCTVISLFNWGESLNFTGFKLHAFKAVILTFFWHLWKARNELVHSSSGTTTSRLFTQIQGFSYFWIITRRRPKFHLHWLGWCCMLF